VPLTTLLDLLRQRLGLNPESLGPALIPDAAARRMEALGLTDLAAYVALAESSAAEFQALAEEIVVGETWFFRGGTLCADLARRMHELTRAAGRPARILSVPCSTGEEPYSLALALLERGTRAWSIDAVDVSADKLANAEAGLYGELSFRQSAPELRSRYFRPEGTAWRLQPEVRALVHFQAGNLVDPLFLAGEAPYDLILCRNLFIYLHPAARQQALAHFDRLLAPTGILCLGHAEALELGEQRFARLDLAAPYLYQRRTSPPKQPPPAPQRRPQPVAPPVPTPSAVVAPRVRPATRGEEPLVEVRRRADAGELTLALELGTAALARGGPSADIYSLLGVIRQARHEAEEARRCFERALYLEPDHEEALSHLVLLCRASGDSAAAGRLEARLRRVAARRES
jgi:chemotaxis protein methyltransferase WspC